MMDSPASNKLQFADEDNVSVPQTPVNSDLSQELRQVFLERRLLTTQNRNRVCLMLASNSRRGTGFPVKRRQASSLFQSEIIKRDDARIRIIREIKSTEITYLQNLDLLSKYFIEPLERNHIIDKNSHRKLFSHIDMIVNMNQEFLRYLENNMDNVSVAFLKMAPCFKLYSVYAFDYRGALLLLQKLTAENAAFRKFLADTESRPEIQRTLNSLMIVPIQRLPRYKLLLDQILLHTSPADQDYKVLKECTKQISETISYIDTCIQNQEVLQMLINIQNSLYKRTPNIVCPSRKVIKEGILEKITRTGKAIKRYCVLMSDIFMYCKILKERAPNTLVENSLECCCIFPLKKCNIYELFTGNFKITCQGDGIIFAEKDLNECSTWIQSIRDTISLHIQHRQTLRKESSKRKPLRRKAVNLFSDETLLTGKNENNHYSKIFRNKIRSKNNEFVYDNDDDDTDEENNIPRFSGFKLCNLKRNVNALCNTFKLDTNSERRMNTFDSSKSSPLPNAFNNGDNLWNLTTVPVKSATNSPLTREPSAKGNYITIHKPGNHLKTHRHLLRREMHIGDNLLWNESSAGSSFVVNVNGDLKGNNNDGRQSENALSPSKNKAFAMKSNFLNTGTKRVIVQDNQSSKDEAPLKKRVKFANILENKIYQGRQSQPFVFSQAPEISQRPSIKQKIQNFFSKLFRKM